MIDVELKVVITVVLELSTPMMFSSLNLGSGICMCPLHYVAQIIRHVFSDVDHIVNV